MLSDFYYSPTHHLALSQINRAGGRVFMIPFTTEFYCKTYKKFYFEGRLYSLRVEEGGGPLPGYNDWEYIGQGLGPQVQVSNELF